MMRERHSRVWGERYSEEPTEAGLAWPAVSPVVAEACFLLLVLLPPSSAASRPPLSQVARVLRAEPS